MLNLNEKFLSNMKNILGNEYDDFLSCIDKPSEKSVFVNSNKISVENFLSVIDFKTTPIDYEKNGFYVDLISGRHPLHHAGAFYFQEPSAMFTVNCLQFNGDEKVLDMCAAPGGKSIQIANRIPNGVLVSNEINHSRSEILYSNIERMGLKNVMITNDTPTNIANSFADCFDVCLVDAPCSGEGMFRKGAEMIENWHEGINESCQIRQLDILEHANKTLKENGYLIYSTCTYSQKENEDVVNEFIKKHNYELININFPFSRGINMEEAVRLYPHKVKGEGQFVALLQKKEANDSFPTKTLKTKSNLIVEKFLNENLNEKINFQSIFEYKGYFYIVPDVNFLKSGVNFVSPGVRIGEIKKDRFIPHQFLFSSFGGVFKTKLNLKLSDPKVNSYLKGETFDVDLKDGFGCFMIGNCPIGGFKVSDGKFKNLYPKGLRNFK